MIAWALASVGRGAYLRRLARNKGTCQLWPCPLCHAFARIAARAAIKLVAA